MEKTLNDSNPIGGSCHCGSVGIVLLTSRNAADLHPRACDCSFCVKHGASYISDPQGSLRIKAQRRDVIGEYRQGSGNARFLICRACGVLIAVVFHSAAGCHGTMNSRCIEGTITLGKPEAISPGQLDSEGKKERWVRLWAPVVELDVPSC